jgi:hypothetical protein
MKARMLVFLCLIALSVGYPLRAAEPAAASSAATAVANHWRDPAFDAVVDVRLLGRAWSELDLALATDVALQLAEGERILERSHRVVTADQAFDLAVQLASQSSDDGAVARLERVLEKQQREELLAQLRSARKLSGMVRSETDPARLVDVQATSPEAFSLYHSCLRDVEAARIGRSAATLTAFRESLPLMPLLNAAQRDYLAARIAAPIPEPNGSCIAAGVLMQLAAASRTSDDAQPYEPPTAGVLQRFLDDGRPDVDPKKTHAALEKLRAVSRCMMGVDC